MEMISEWFIVAGVAFALGVLAGVGVSWSAMIRRVSIQVSRAAHAAYEASYGDSGVRVDTPGDTTDRVSSHPEGRRVIKPIRQVPPDH